MTKAAFNRRLSYTLLLAMIMHAFAVFAIGFSGTNETKTASTIEVTLAQYQAPDTVKEADFFAQIDQLGSGQAQEKKLLSQDSAFSPATENMQDTKQPTPTNPSEQLANRADKSQPAPITKAKAEFDVILTEQSSVTSVTAKMENLTKEVIQEPSPQNISQQIAKLKSEINLRQEKMARAPKVRTISTISAKSHQDAEYLENWRRKIVSVGNSHYPKAANEQKIYGRVRLLIAMQANGEIQSLKVLESSGKKILDISAIKIIKLAAPFQPFSAEMRRNTDVLEIIRTIEFEKTTLIY